MCSSAAKIDCKKSALRKKARYYKYPFQYNMYCKANLIAIQIANLKEIQIYYRLMSLNIFTPRTSYKTQ